jgi:hypothetical protein
MSLSRPLSPITKDSRPPSFQTDQASDRFAVDPALSFVSIWHLAEIERRALNASGLGH